MLVALHAPTHAGDRDSDVATVHVTKQVRPSEVVYSYSVTNTGKHPLVGLTIGFDPHRGSPELSGAHPLAVASPARWAGRVITLEASDLFEIGWDTDGTAPAIQPGQTLTGFQIRSARENERLTRSHWTVVVDGPPSRASSLLEADSATSPAGTTGVRP